MLSIGPGRAWDQPLLTRVAAAEAGDWALPRSVRRVHHDTRTGVPIRFQTVAAAATAPSWSPSGLHRDLATPPHRHQMGKGEQDGGLRTCWGPGGGPFDDLKDLGLDPSTIRIVGLIIRSGQFIDAITPIYLDGDGQLALPKHGGDGGLETRFGLRSGEFITEISGRSGEFVDSLTIETNLGARIGLGGLGGGPVEGYEIPPDTEGAQEVVAFFGASGDFIDSIGIHTRPR